MSQTLILIGFLLLVFALQTFFFIKRYIKVPPNKLMVIYGKVSQDPQEKYLIHTSGSHFVWPVIQEYEFMDISPRNMKVEVTTQDSHNASIFCRLLIDYKISQDSELARKYVELMGVNNEEGSSRIIQEKVSRVLKEALGKEEKIQIISNPKSFEDRLMQTIKSEWAAIGLELVHIGDLSVR